MMMFPNARNSIRQWSEVATTTTNVPIPIAVTLHNFVLIQQQQQQQQQQQSSTKTSQSETSILESVAAKIKEEENDDIDNIDTIRTSATTSSTRSKWFHHLQHDSKLLPYLRLDIIVTTPCDNDRKSSSKDDDIETKELVVYSQTISHRAVHPSWEHLDEQIQIPKSTTKNIQQQQQQQNNTSCPYWWKNDEIYKSMKMRIYIIKDNEGTNEETQDSSSLSATLFMEVPIHPSFLQRIDVLSATSDDGNTSSNVSVDKDDDNDNEGGETTMTLLANNNNNDNNKNNNTMLPPLPPNTLLIYYSDGTIRCLSHIYELLWEYQHITEAPQVEDFSRFDDDIFKTLDHVSHSTTIVGRERTASSLLDQENEQNQHHHHHDDDDDTLQKMLQEQREQEQQIVDTISNGAITTPADITNETGNGFSQHNDVLFPYTEQDVVKIDLKRQNEELLRLIELEEQAMEEEYDCMKEEQQSLVNTMNEIQKVEKDIRVLKIEVQQQSIELQHDELLKEAQSIKLLRDLKPIYPITLDSAATATPTTSSSTTLSLSIIGNTTTTRGMGGGYLIRGLRLPVDIYTTTVPEEEINASLGYCAHLVFMIAKYLTIQLRHRIFCNSSRSAIQQDGVGVFPLFLGRSVARALEREQVDRGVRLLGANVNCILMHLNLPTSLQQMHILARLKAILDFVANGSLENVNDQPATDIPIPA